jgi:hypothetical protein
MTQPGGAAVAESALRQQVRSAAGLIIVTGGQTGVDTYAAHAALHAGLPVRVIFPAGLRQEDGGLTAARRRRLRGAELHELTSASFRYRTWTCVYVSDAVLLLDPAGGSGCRETLRAARSLGRPLFAPDPGSLTCETAAAWLAETAARVVLVAGCRSSVLGRRGKGQGLRTQLAAFMTSAQCDDDQLGTGLAGGQSPSLARGRQGLALVAPVDDDSRRGIRMALEPAACERAERDDGQTLGFRLS